MACRLDISPPQNLVCLVDPWGLPARLPGLLNRRPKYVLQILHRLRVLKSLLIPFVPWRRRRSATKPYRFVWRLLKGTISKFFRDGGSFLAAGLAFNLLLYCVPFLLLVVSTITYTLGSPERALALVEASAKELLPHSSQYRATGLISSPI